MGFTIQLGWWLVPALITLAALGYMISFGSRQNSNGHGGGLYGGFQGLAVLVVGAIALVVVLLAWLIWALFN